MVFKFNFKLLRHFNKIASWKLTFSSNFSLAVLVQINAVAQELSVAPLTAMMTLRSVSMCHLMLGANCSAAVTHLDEHTALNSGSAFSRNARSSFIIVRTLPALTSAKESCMALRLMVMSSSLRHSRMVVRCLCTAWLSWCTTWPTNGQSTSQRLYQAKDYIRPKIISGQRLYQAKDYISVLILCTGTICCVLLA